jgi:hypothetical protein
VLNPLLRSTNIISNMLLEPIWDCVKKIKLLSQKKKSFWGKASFLSFCQKYFLTIFRLLRPLKVLLIFLPKDYPFFQTCFLSVKSTFKPLKHNLKQALSLLRADLALHVNYLLNTGTVFFFFFFFQILLIKTNKYNSISGSSKIFEVFYFISFEILLQKCNQYKRIFLSSSYQKFI